VTTKPHIPPSSSPGQENNPHTSIELQQAELRRRRHEKLRELAAIEEQQACLESTIRAKIHSHHAKHQADSPSINPSTTTRAATSSHGSSQSSHPIASSKMKQTTKQSRDVWDSSSDESNGLQTTFAQPLIKGKRIATRPRRPQHEAQFPLEENQEIVQSAVMFADSPGGIPEYRAPNPSQTSGGLTAKKEASSNANKPWKIIEESKPSRYEGPAPGNKAFKLMVGLYSDIHPTRVI
jgi:hypothetical protein